MKKIILPTVGAKKAFTLMGLMIVIVIIGILSTVGMVMFGGQSEKAKIAVMKTHHDNVVKTITFEMFKCTLGETYFFVGTTKYGGNYRVQCGTTKEWRAGSARNGAYNSIALKNPWKNSEFTIVENTTAPRFEKGKVIVSSSGNEVSVRSCWADGCDSSNRKLDTIVTD